MSYEEYVTKVTKILKLKSIEELEAKYLNIVNGNSDSKSRC